MTFWQMFVWVFCGLSAFFAITGLLVFFTAKTVGYGRRRFRAPESEADLIIGDGAAPWTQARYPQSRANWRSP